MVVAQVVLTLDPGGQEYVVIQLAERLQRRGVRSPVITLSGGSLAPEARRRGIAVYDIGKRDGLDLSVPLRLWSILRRERATHVHTHNIAPLIYGSLTARALGIPAINTRHGRAALSTHRLVWSLTRQVVAVSEDARRELLKHNTLDAAKVSVILNGVDIATFGNPAESREEVRASLGIPTEASVFGIVGRLAPEKDHRTLLEAFRRVLQEGIDAHLVVVGGGPLEEDLKALAAGLGVQPAVHFLGFRQDIPAILRALDVFVLSSTMEGISLTLLEAMAARLPLVATNVGGNPEVVVEGVTGILVPPGDAGAMANAMATLHSDPGRARHYGDSGHQRAVHVFDIDRMVDAYLRLYTEVAG